MNTLQLLSAAFALTVLGSVASAQIVNVTEMDSNIAETPAGTPHPPGWDAATFPRSISPRRVTRTRAGRHMPARLRSFQISAAMQAGLRGAPRPSHFLL